MVKKGLQLNMDERLFMESSQCDFKDNMTYVCCRMESKSLLPDFKSCGVSSAGDRIVGGEKTKIDEFPWLALIQYQYGE
jgi:hypothetical protein